MAQLITEAKRFQELAGILTENKETRNPVMEGYNLFFEIMGYNSLLEVDEEPTLTKKDVDFFALLDLIYQENPKLKSDTKFQDLLKKSIEALDNQPVSIDQIKQSLQSNNVKEAEEKYKYKSILAGFGEYLRNTKIGTAIRALPLLLMLSTQAPTVHNAINSISPDNTHNITVQQDVHKATNLSSDDHKTADLANVKVDGKTLDQLDNDPHTATSFVKFQYGKGNGEKALDGSGKAELAKTIQGIKNILKQDPKADVNVDVVGKVSKTTGKAKQGTDTKKDLDVARGETVYNALKAAFADSKNVKIELKPDKPDAFQSQTQEKEKGTDGAGAVVKITSKAPVKPLPTADLKKQFDYEYAEFDAGMPKDTTSGEEVGGGGGAEELPTPQPAPIESDTEITNKTSNLGKLNRNGQIATVLATINPSLDMAKALKADAIDNYTDRFLTTTKGDARKIAALILNIRKNPDSLLKKVSKALDIKLEPRAKAVATQPSTSTQAQLQPVKENISMVHLLEEAMIDQLSDEDIKKNKKAILAFLGTMYASAGNTQLSVVPKNVAEKEELTNLGFVPQPGGNYVFLGDKTKAQALGYDTLQDKNKTQSDVSNISKSLKTKSTFKSLLRRIDTVKEFTDLILTIFDQVDSSLKNDKTKVRSSLFSLRNRIPVKEVETDTSNVIQAILRDGIFTNLLKRINTVEEAIQLILRDIIPYLNPNLIKDKVKLKNAIIGAANQYSKNQQATPTNTQAKTPPATK
jgi:hypothetical protein